MKKVIIFYAVLFFINIGFVSSFDLEVEKISKGDIALMELDNPVVFDLNINNKGESDISQIYSLVSVLILPKSKFTIPAGSSSIEIKAYPGDFYKEREGIYSFEYQIKGDNQGIFKDKLMFKVISLKKVFEIGSIDIKPNDKGANIKIKNNVNAFLENIEINLKSSFFDARRTISLKPFESVEVPVELFDSKKLFGLEAGPYLTDAIIKVENVSVNFEGKINYLEDENVMIKEENKGIIIRENKITKINDGNIPVKVTIEMEKDIISRLFTTYSIEPLKSERSGISVNYVWEKNLKPGESFSVSSNTNYSFPFILIILIIFIIILVKVYTARTLNVRKSVYLVKTKGGEFALKVRIQLNAKKSIKDVKLIDKLPHMAKLYDKFGRRPDKIDNDSRQLYWNVGGLSKGEERVFSYVIYSKLRAVGRFELPPARVLFEKDGERESVSSNRAFFVSETSLEE